VYQVDEVEPLVHVVLVPAPLLASAVIVWLPRVCRVMLAVQAIQLASSGVAAEGDPPSTQNRTLSGQTSSTFHSGPTISGSVPPTTVNGRLTMTLVPGAGSSMKMSRIRCLASPGRRIATTTRSIGLDTRVDWNAGTGSSA
jgi:hypothetical protein